MTAAADPTAPFPSPEGDAPRNGTSDGGTPPASAAPGRPLSEGARRALLEAEARRAAAEPRSAPGEQGGPTGPEPTRFGDWERKGLAVDF